MRVPHQQLLLFVFLMVVILIEVRLIFDKGGKNIQWTKAASSTNVTGKTGY
jgi:hypothetical protein